LFWSTAHSIETLLTAVATATPFVGHRRPVSALLLPVVAATSRPAGASATTIPFSLSLESEIGKGENLISQIYFTIIVVKLSLWFMINLR